MKVAIYAPYANRLWGTLAIGPSGILPTPSPFADVADQESDLERLQRIMREWRPPGIDDESFLKLLPRVMRGRAVMLDALEDPTPGFEDMRDDYTQFLGAERHQYAEDEPSLKPAAALVAKPPPQSVIKPPVATGFGLGSQATPALVPGRVPGLPKAQTPPEPETVGKAPPASPQPSRPPSSPIQQKIDGWQPGHELVQQLEPHSRQAISVAKQLEMLDKQLWSARSVDETRVLLAAQTDLRQRSEGMAEQHRQALAERMQIQKPLEMLHFPDNVILRDPQRRESVKAAGTFLSSVCEHFEDAIHGGEVVAHYQAAGPGQYRSFWDGARIHVAKSTGTVSVLVHEMGHLLEHRMPGAKEAAHAFLKHRVGDEVPVRMKDLPGGYGFGKGEFGRKDKFDVLFPGVVAYYVGKDYGDQHTEIISMGLQALRESPAAFAAKDPEYFRFITGLLKGAFQTP